MFLNTTHKNIIFGVHSSNHCRLKSRYCGKKVMPGKQVGKVPTETTLKNDLRPREHDFAIRSFSSSINCKNCCWSSCFFIRRCCLIWLPARNLVRKSGTDECQEHIVEDLTHFGQRLGELYWSSRNYGGVCVPLPMLSSSAFPLVIVFSMIKKEYSCCIAVPHEAPRSPMMCRCARSTPDAP